MRGLTAGTRRALLARVRLLLLFILAPSLAFAQVSAEDVADAPKPGEESGRIDRDEGDGAGRTIGRALLWVPRLPVEVVVQPIRGALYLKDRYHAFSWIANLFTTEDKTVAIFPTAIVETGFGWNVGARARFKDVFGGGERIKLRAGIGGAHKSIAELQAETDDSRIVAGGISLRLERRDEERFYGYGNGSIGAPPAMPVDPTQTTTAYGSEFRLEAARIAPFVRVALPHDLAITASAAYLRDRTQPTPLDTDDDPMDDLDERPIDTYYDTSKLPGFGTRDSLYSELELAWDTRRPASSYDPPGIPATGGRVAVFGGRHEGLGSRDFYRGGFDVQRFIPLTRGPRVIELRAYAEGVSGDRDQVPFLELPRLGGERLLRGYDRGRFRDRVAAVAQVGYLFALSRFFAVNLFADVGRVYSGLDALTIDDQRVGFGAALEVYSTTSLVVRAEIASSIDGSMFAYVSLDPAWEAHARTERR